MKIETNVIERLGRPPDWRFIDMRGQRFGRLRILHRDGVDTSGHIRWIARCDCGTRTRVDGDDLRSGRIAGCGCLMRQRRRAFGRASRLVRMSLRQAILIYCELENAVGSERLEKIFAAVAAENRKRKSEKHTNYENKHKA
jgi:hypothetical protein